MNITENEINSDGEISVLVLGGVHGNELTPIRCLNFFQNSLENIDNSNIHKVIIINNINLPGLKSNSRFFENDNTTDLNRSFDSEASLNKTIEILKSQINSAHVVIDVHSSPNIDEFVLIDIDEYCEAISEWCKEIPRVYRYSSANTIKRYALEKGKFATTIELNKLDVIDENSADVGSHMITNLINNIKDSNINNLKSNDFIIPNELYEQKTHIEGFLKMKVYVGDYVEKGQIIAEILDMNFEKKLDLKSNMEGLIISAPTIGYVNRGETLFLIQPKN